MNCVTEVRLATFVYNNEANAQTLLTTNAHITRLCLQKTDDYKLKILAACTTYTNGDEWAGYA
jgi:hypothetical protein